MSSSPPLSPPPPLPYFIDSDVKLNQSNTILRYIAHKHNLGECRGGGQPKGGGGGGGQTLGLLWGVGGEGGPSATIHVQVGTRRRSGSAWMCWRTR